MSKPTGIFCRFLSTLDIMTGCRYNLFDKIFEVELTMKKALKIILPILLTLAILLGIGWYLFIYDTEFTRDMLLSGARYFESKGDHSVAAWFYDLAYDQAGDNDAVAAKTCGGAEGAAFHEEVLCHQGIESAMETQAAFAVDGQVAVIEGVEKLVEFMKKFEAENA